MDMILELQCPYHGSEEFHFGFELSGFFLIRSLKSLGLSFLALRERIVVER